MKYIAFDAHACSAGHSRYPALGAEGRVRLGHQSVGQCITNHPQSVKRQRRGRAPPETDR
jgi:hypothetical protein